MKKWPLIIAAPLLLAVGVFAALQLRPHTFSGTVIQSPEPAPDFTLQTAGGDTFTLSQQQGDVVVLFFGYTHCPDVCPTSLFELRRTMELLGPRADKVQVVFVSVDPTRDTPQQAATYAANFNPRFVGVTGEANAVNAVATQYGIYYAAGEVDETGSYMVDHTASLVVVDRDGHLKLLFPPEVSAEAMAADLRQLLRR